MQIVVIHYFINYLFLTLHLVFLLIPNRSAFALPHINNPHPTADATESLKGIPTRSYREAQTHQ